MQFLALLVQHLARVLTRIPSGFERVSQVGEAHQPDGVGQVLLPAQMKGDPSGIGNPTVLLGKAVGKERVVNRAREWDVESPVPVEVTDFGFPEAKLSRSKLVGMYGHFRPGQDFLFKPFGGFHIRLTPALWMSCGDCPIQGHSNWCSVARCG